MALQRSIGVVGLTFVGVSGVLGSGWLFAPLLAANYAGPAAIVAWVLCGIAVLLLALTFAEVCGRLPVAGGLGRIPFFTHGRLVAAAMGWTAWIGYLVAAPIEVAVMIQYLAGPFPVLEDPGADHQLSTLGIIVAVAMLAFVTMLNALGVAFFARLNTGLTWFKLGVPVLVGVLIILDRFQMANFTDHPSFAPMGMHGIFSAIATGGVVFAFIGFRHAIDMAGEATRPHITVPMALCFTVVICLVIYLLLQLAFIGALSEADLAKGWQKISFTDQLGPLGAIALALGMFWLSVLVLAGAVVAPFGGALVATGSNARLGLALAHNGFFPSLFTRLSLRDVPLNALLLNFSIGVAAFLFLPFEELLALNGAALTFSLTVGPVCVLALRHQDGVPTAGFRLPLVGLFAFAAFIVATLIVYWSGWDTVWRLGVALAVGAVLFAVMNWGSEEHLPIRPALWLIPYLVGLLLLSRYGQFGDGLGVIGFGWDALLGALLGAGCLWLAVRLRLDNEAAREHRSQDADAPELFL